MRGYVLADINEDGIATAMVRPSSNRMEDYEGLGSANERNQVICDVAELFGYHQSADYLTALDDLGSAILERAKPTHPEEGTDSGTTKPEQ